MLKVDRLAIPGLPLLTFDVAAGECLAIEGPSGSGKTRILRAIADLDEAGGYVYLEGAERGELSAHIWRQRVRYCAAEPGWWADSARRHITRQPELQRFERMAATLGLGDDALDAPLAQLSTGERLRLALARALADEPRVLLLDEPTAALDVASRALTEELIRFQILARRAIVLVCHDAGQISRLAHRSLLLGGARQNPTLGATPTFTAPNSPVAPQPINIADPRIQSLADRWGRSL